MFTVCQFVASNVAMTEESGGMPYVAAVAVIDSI